MSDKPKNILVHVRPGDALPFWVHLGHRHLEKAPPQIDLSDVTELCQPVPVDMLRVTDMPSGLIDDIASLSIIYVRPKADARPAPLVHWPHTSGD